MKIKTRFITSITRTATEMAEETSVALPWERGARRAAFIAKRRGEILTLKTA